MKATQLLLNNGWLQHNQYHWSKNGMHIRKHGHAAKYKLIDKDGNTLIDQDGFKAFAARLVDIDKTTEYETALTFEEFIEEAGYKAYNESRWVNKNTQLTIVRRGNYFWVKDLQNPKKYYVKRINRPELRMWLNDFHATNKGVKNATYTLRNNEVE